MDQGSLVAAMRREPSDCLLQQSADQTAARPGNEPVKPKQLSQMLPKKNWIQELVSRHWFQELVSRH